MYARTTASGVRSSWVTSAMSSAARPSSATSCSTCVSASAWRRPFSTMPASRSAIADSCATSPSVNSRWVSVWTLSTPTTWSRQVSGTESIECDEPALVDAPDPQEAGVRADVHDDIGWRDRGHPPGDPLPERHDGAADLVAVEPVRRREPEVEPVPVEEVERGDVRPERVARAVDHGLEELLPGPGGRRQAEELVEAGGAARAAASRGSGRARRARPRPAGVGRPDAAARCGPVVERRHGEHDTSLEAAATFDGCSGVPARCPWSRTVTVACWRPRAAHASLRRGPASRPARRAPRSTSGPRFPAVAAEPPGPGFGRARDPLAREVRLLGALLGQVIAEQAGPDLFELVERIRRRTIALRRGDPEVISSPTPSARGSAHEIASLDLDQAAAVARAFTLYFQLVNLAEERQRIRVLRDPRP